MHSEKSWVRFPACATSFGVFGVCNNTVKQEKKHGKKEKSTVKHVRNVQVIVLKAMALDHVCEEVVVDEGVVIEEEVVVNGKIISTGEVWSLGGVCVTRE